MNTHEIVTSAGGVGVERRSFNRLYVTPSEPIESTQTVRDLYSRIESTVDRRRSVSRGVLRVVTNMETILETSDTGIVPEATIPLEKFDRDDSFLAIYAHNDWVRSRTIEPIDTMLELTAEELSPCAPTDTQLGARYSLSSIIGPSQYASLLELWGTTFGWTPEQIRSFARAIMLQQNTVVNNDRSLWFSGLETSDSTTNPHAYVSAAMAERVDLPGFNKTVHVVESTEWRSSANRARPLGSIVPVLQSLNSQILRDIPDAVILAECNFTSRADRRGHQAGFVIPDRTLAPQILVQNVGVHDGKNNWPLRDFTMMMHQNILGDSSCM